jgi:hypothetical protein
MAAIPAALSSKVSPVGPICFSGHGPCLAVANEMNTTTIREKTFAVGKYLVSPLIKRTELGDYAASVSIRSGRGSGTHDRVLRFVPRFPTPEGAHRYAIEQGVHWAQDSSFA